MQLEHTVFSLKHFSICQSVQLQQGLLNPLGFCVLKKWKLVDELMFVQLLAS